MVFIRFPFHCDLKVLDYGINPVNGVLLKHDIVSYVGTDELILLHHGKPLHNEDVIPNDSSIQVTFLLPGGKGGFGSMLRAIGAQIEKTTNREACRDLSGRRLRDINEEQRLKKWIAKKAEREAEKIRRRKERIERLKSKAPHKFFDFEYEKEISELPTRINDALSEGLQKAKQPSKRPLEKSEKPLKKTWLADEFPSSSSSDSETEETNSATDTSPSKKLKSVQNNNSSCDSDASQSLPGSSKDSCFILEESSVSCDSVMTENKDQNSSTSDNFDPERDENSSVSDNVNAKNEQASSSDNGQMRSDEDVSSSSVSNSKVTDSAENTVDRSVEVNVTVSDANTSQSVENEQETVIKDSREVTTNSAEKDLVSSKPEEKNPKKEEKDESPIDLLDFENISELEALGLDRLKFALMARGLKCGGTLSDRAQRLWKVRGLQPHEYPANLLAKKK